MRACVAATLAAVLLAVAHKSTARRADGTASLCAAGVAGDSASRTAHIVHGLLNRSYRVHVPASACAAGAAGNPVAAVVHLHCYGCPCGTGGDRGWVAEAEARGVVLIEPCGDGQGGGGGGGAGGARRHGFHGGRQEVPSWNAGPCCGEAVRQGRDDIGFVQVSRHRALLASEAAQMLLARAAMAATLHRAVCTGASRHTR